MTATRRTVGSMKANVLVVANRTAASPDLVACLRERAERSPARFDLLIPPTAPGEEGRAQARKTLEAAVAAYGDAGLEATGSVGEATDPVTAACEAYDPGHHDEIIVSTLPAGASHWLSIDGPARISRQTGALVRHVESRPPRPEPAVQHVEKQPGPGVLAPFVALGFGGKRQS
jgi:hypothetical protein